MPATCLSRTQPNPLANNPPSNNPSFFLFFAHCACTHACTRRKGRERAPFKVARSEVASLKVARLEVGRLEVRMQKATSVLWYVVMCSLASLWACMYALSVSRVCIDCRYRVYVYIYNEYIVAIVCMYTLSASRVASSA